MAQRIIQNIVGGIHKHEIDRVSQAFTKNMFVESVNAEQSMANKILLSVKGQSLAVRVGNGACRGLYRASRGIDGNPLLFGCFGNSVYVIRQNGDSVNASKIGQVSNAMNTPVHFCETGGNGNAHPHLIVVDGASIYAVDTTLADSYMMQDWRAISLPTRVGDATHANKIRPTHCAYLYGYLIVNDANTDAFYTSVQYPFETLLDNGEINYDIFYSDVNGEYNGYGFVTYAEWSTDNITALVSNGSYLYTFGQRSVQAFSYRDDVNMPFTSPDNAAENIGIKAPNSIATCGKYVAWLGSSDMGNNGIYIMEGNAKKRVSSISIEREISRMNYPEDAIGQFWEENQHLFYAITFRTDKTTLVYDVKENEWHARESYDHGYWRPQFATFAYNKIFFGSLTENALVYLDNDKYTEYDNSCIVRLRRGGVVYSDNSPFYCDAMNLTLNNGAIDNPTIEPKVMMRYSVDGNDWTDTELGMFGAIGRYDVETTWWHLGIAKFLTIEISCSDPIDFAILSAKINASPCNVF